MRKNNLLLRIKEKVRGSALLWKRSIKDFNKIKIENERERETEITWKSTAESNQWLTR